MFVFPCGHCVCNACDQRLKERSFYACPTCREPRAGISRAQVDAAATARVRRDEMRDRVADGFWPQSSESFGSVEHNGQRYEIIFLPDESEGRTPFDVIRTVANSAPNIISPRMVSRRTVNHRPAEQQPVIDLTGDDEEGEPVERPQPVRRGVALPPVLAEMITEMLQPTHLPQWLRRHDALTGMMVASQPSEV